MFVCLFVLSKKLLVGNLVYVMSACTASPLDCLWTSSIVPRLPNYSMSYYILKLNFVWRGVLKHVPSEHRKHVRAKTIRKERDSETRTI